MFRKVRFYAFLSLCGFCLSLGLSTQRPALSQATPAAPSLPPEVTTCLPVAAPNTDVNQYETLASYTESEVHYLALLVTPPKPPAPETATAGSAETPEPPADENAPLPYNPWRLVISYTATGCQALTTPEQQSLAQVPQSVARQLELQRYQKVITESGGLEAFKQALFGFANDPHHGGDVPEQVNIAPESAWALQQLGIQLPSNWVVSP